MFMPRRLFSALAVLAIVAMSAVMALRDSTLANACFVHAPQPVQVWNDVIDIEINENVANKRYTCVFLNPNANAVVGGECFMELEPGAQVDGFSMMVDGEQVQGELMPVDKANEVFTEIVRNGGSPALLEYYGNLLFHTKIPNIPPQGKVTVNLHYSQILQPRDGVYRLKMLNTNPKMSMQALEHAAVSIKIKSSQPVTNVYSPTHEIKIDETDDGYVHITWSEDDYLPRNSFVVYYKTTPDPLGVNLLAHKAPGEEEGTFMLMLSPSMMQEVGSEDGEDGRATLKPMPKDIVFCVDTSGSMLENGKLDQLKAALTYCVENLRDGDRFNIIDFATATRRMSYDGLLTISEGTRQRGLTYVGKIVARGGTAIEEALTVSIDQLSELEATSDRTRMIVFITDGVPTIGQTNADPIIESVRTANKNGTRIFSFGVGLDVNAKLLDMLAHDNLGQSDYILPKESITERIGSFFDRIGSPLMTNLSFDFGGVPAFEVYPRRVPDLYAGDQVLVVGRYSAHGTATITLKGTNGNGATKLEQTFELPEMLDVHDWLPRMWAGKKIDFLLNELRKNPNQDEVIKEVVALAQQHGIVTPYTNYLLTNDVFASAEQQQQQFSRRLRNGAAGSAPASPADREALANESARMAEGRDDARGGDAYNRAQAEFDAMGGSGSVMSQMRVIGGVTFYFNQATETWTQSDLVGSDELTVVELGSDKYFELFNSDTSIAKFLAMGEVIFSHGGTSYHIKK